MSKAVQKEAIINKQQSLTLLKNMVSACLKSVQHQLLSVSAD